MVKLIVSDLDGTLVPEGAGALPKELIDTLNRVQRGGIPFAVSSGRQHASLREVFRPLEMEPYILSLNGGCVCKGEQCLYTDPMPQQTALAIAEAANQLPWADVILETRQQCWVYHPTNGVAEELAARQYRYEKIDRLDQVEGEVIKVACYLTAELPAFLAQNQCCWGAEIKVARSGEHWVDFNTSDKGKGLLALCRLLEIEPAETVAFGDNLNDQPMLEAAGQGWAAAQGNPELRRMFSTCADPRLEMEKILRENGKTSCNLDQAVLL